MAAERSRPGPRFLLAALLLAFCLLPKRLGFSADQTPRSRPRPKRKPRKKPAILVVDGAACGEAHWAPALELVEKEGAVAESFICLQSQEGSDKTCVAARAEGLTPIVWLDGGDAELSFAMEVGRLATREDIGTVALLVGERDYCHLAARLTQLGKRCVAVLTAQRLARAFRDAGATVLCLNGAEGEETGRPKMKAVLGPEGACFEALSWELDEEVGRKKEALLLKKLLDLGYKARKEDPVAPAVAKLFHVNGLGALPVWPPALATWQGAEALPGEGQTWREHTGDLAYVLPVKQVQALTEEERQEYGTRECRGVVAAGGPFVMKSSAQLPDRVLERLGYQGDFKEAARRFLAENAKAMRELDIDVQGVLDEHSLRALLHRALVSSRHDGRWALALSEAAAE